LLDQWAREAGVDLGPRALSPFIERMEREVCAAPQAAESLGEDNRIMKAGAEKLGWEYLDNRRAQHKCVGTNNCILGCPTGAKQSMLVSFLPRAFARGARCLTEVRVERLIIESGRCVGVSGRAIDPRTRRASKKVSVRARAVVIACGAVQTPLLLQAHRLGRPSRLLGGNFTCHPNVKVMAVYPHEVRAWQGVSQAGQITQYKHKGIKLAENMVPPGALAAQLHCHGSEAWELMRDYHRIVLTGVLIHDSTTGTVRRAPLGLGGPRYLLTRYDHERLVEGARRLAELHFAMGAERVLLPFAHLPMLRNGDDLSKIDASGIGRGALDLFTVHLMGTARMGRSPKSSVVNLSGQLWDLPGCYVADASLFPTAVGTNPQSTIMALASLVASRIELAPRVRASGGLRGFVRGQANRMLEASHRRAPSHMPATDGIVA
ncbi:MAG: GMC family oxidoreductase N-terminal domain-containing protein, partial [Polyangiaceae bacterium]|nr:GMC family oxidoreductase N-terminal domain-containing protein [Polyangiaceae bacterium]